MPASAWPAEIGKADLPGRPAIKSSLLFTYLSTFTMSPFPPLAALFLSHFHDLKGQEITYYASLSDGKRPPLTRTDSQTRFHRS